LPGREILVLAVDGKVLIGINAYLAFFHIGRI